MSKFKNFLTESGKPKILNELFINISDIKDIPQGDKRDSQLLRLAMSAELDAANLYEAMARLTNNEDLKNVLLDIANEEKTHAGEFETMLEEIDPDYEYYEEEGEEEVEDMLGRELD